MPIFGNFAGTLLSQGAHGEMKSHRVMLFLKFGQNKSLSWLQFSIKSEASHR